MPLAAALSSLMAWSTGAASAFDFSGSASFFVTALDAGGEESDLEEQQYSLSLFQTLTPYVSLRLGYTHLDYSTKSLGDNDFLRRSREPRLELTYNRDRLTGRLELRERTADGNFPADNYQARSLVANLAWRPRRGPGFILGFRDESNAADEAVFGRSVDTRTLSFETFYNRKHWGASYALRNSRIENRSTGFDSDQDRHEVRAYASRRLAQNRVTVSLSSSLSRLERQTFIPEGSDFAEPVAPLEGLFAVDTSPEIGEVPTAPELIDGDLNTPVPGIAIGGGNTFRNVGVSLPVLSPVSKLEITVDVPSDPSLAWQIYSSSDNLIWQSISGALSTFDEALLRYTIRFPETTDRFFKAVNVSVNGEPVVGVTEIRALLDRPVDGGRDQIESTLYRADFRTDYRPTDRVTASVSFGLSNDEDLSGDFVRRDFNEEHGDARLSVALLPELLLTVGYQYNDSENLRQPVLLRTVETVFASLTWTPLPTVDAVFSAQEREELEETTLLQSVESTRLLLTTELLPDLRLVTDLESSTVETPLLGLTRDGWTWSERLEASPTRRWTLGGGYTVSRFESSDGELLFERSQFDLRTTWIATRYLSLSGVWSVGEEANSENVRQSYSLSYNPGPKLSISAFYQQYETISRRGTESDALAASYRVNNHLSLFANLARSTFGEGGDPSDETTSLRTGLRLLF